MLSSSPTNSTGKPSRPGIIRKLILASVSHTRLATSGSSGAPITKAGPPTSFPRVLPAKTGSTVCCESDVAAEERGTERMSFSLAIPALIRLIQCIKRWYDSRLQIHLINAGKYTSNVVQYAFYVYWRSRGNSLHDHSFPLWVTYVIIIPGLLDSGQSAVFFRFASISSIYTSSWDLSVDWGLLRPRHAFLRESLGYPTIRPVSVIMHLQTQLLILTCTR